MPKNNSSNALLEDAATDIRVRVRLRVEDSLKQTMEQRFCDPKSWRVSKVEHVVEAVEETKKIQSADHGLRFIGSVDEEENFRIFAERLMALK